MITKVEYVLHHSQATERPITTPIVIITIYGKTSQKVKFGIGGIRASRRDMLIFEKLYGGYRRLMRDSAQ